MKIKLSDYIKEIEEKIKNNKVEKNLSKEVYTWIKFFQHERLVHLIVTFFTGIGMILFLLGTLYFENIGILSLFIITFILFVPYIFHYYNLENGVQKLYNLYFEVLKKEKN